MESWIEAAAAVLALTFSFFSWLFAGKSVKARRAAEAAEANARRSTEAAEDTAAELRKLVEQLSLPPLVATRGEGRSNDALMLRNTTSELIVVEQVLNVGSFARIDLASGELPITIPPGAQIVLYPLVPFGSPYPSNLHLRISGSGQRRDVHVPIPPRS
ncbi:hypothetical protein [Glutamicibacter creatinolyticus]|uniref:hypothetical protein n=1 Tax=Glutamicibacter creatinolyticus TaxID=162496 RepID=UPI00321750FD